jgi:hypothetical protein
MVKHHYDQRTRAEVMELQERMNRRNEEDATILRNMRQAFVALDAPSQARVAGFLGGGGVV